MIPRLDYQDSLSPTTLSFLELLGRSAFRGDIEKSYASRLAMATDNSVYQVVPQAVLYPRSADDIAVMLKLAAEPAYHTLSFFPRGGGTGTNGQSLGGGIIVDLSRHMNQIMEINLEEGWVRAQAGVVKDQLNAYLKPHGYFFSPDLSTSNRATLGGMINTDASGQGSLVYGKTSDHVLGLKAVLENGDLMATEPLTGERLADKLALENREGEIYRTLYRIGKERRADIEATFPKLNRFLTGYDLKHLYQPDTDTLDVSRVLCGSEGSLGFITEAKLNITPIPRYRTLVNVKYDSFPSALRNAPFMVQAQALSVETVDSRVLGLARADIIWHSVQELIQDVPGKDLQGLNIVEFADTDEAEHQAKVAELCRRIDALLAKGEAGIIGYQVCDHLPSIETIYTMRKKSVGLLGNAEGRKKPVAFTEDTAVPPESLADFIMEFRALLDAHGLDYGMFGHVDAGVLHVRPALDLCDPEQEVLLRRISDQVVALTAKYGGLMWGEHGKGFRSEYSPAFFGELWEELQRIKGAFDPSNRINPGKICIPYGSGAELVSVDGPKRGKFDRQIPLAVRTSYTRAMDCNGNGLCFTFETDSPMCPSVKISRDRRHSPKGRAGLMREWLRQLAEQGFDSLAEEVALQSGGVRFKQLVDKVRNSWAKQRGEYDFSHEVMEAMAGCLACKACTSQCPIKVDVPDFRARFMQLYHGRYLRAPKDYFVGTVESYAPLLAKAPKLVNFFLEKEWAQKAAEKSIGMVDVPLLSVPTLAESLHDNRARYFDLPGLERMSAEQRKQVVLIVQDPFTSYYDAPVVRDLVKLASKLGFQPYLLPFKPNGKPQHIKGFLRAFARTAANSAQFLNKVAALGIPMVGVDPAMVLCYRDEYAKALGSARGDFQVLLPQEWLLSLPADQLPASANKTKIEEGSEPWYLFAHCTEKTAKPSTHGDWSTLFGRFGASLQPVSVGCCGMAGTYGHDVKQVENSKGIYGLSWADPLARLPKARCLATGYSCRSQVKRMEGEKLKHPLQALLELL
ncbi:D-2-hydroxyglutarate dehydrogenase YdiJ [Aeromonas veronii]|uniref:D-2-hydroxyglutarate dehydrogenase YdiJ n=1 Tax=Aeromonas veronii TaxID=654 RepID=UPI00191DB755|nr:FAD-binding and (Fe-S)-binding domain-containing protein [Aeromonas veronii]MBL0472538.1 FAD-binding oxidoreductase [Aeromonas veronii]MCX0438693.1 FAD-binding oxidoreductase [Aeromonas veronii]